MFVSDDLPQTDSQSLKEYLLDLVEHPIKNRKAKLSHQLQSLGIESYLIQSTNDARMNHKSSFDEDMILLGIAGRISKVAIPYISSGIHQQLPDFKEAHTHLVLLLDSHSMIEFAFYKFLTDLILTKQIHSLAVFSTEFDRSIELGIEFIQNFTATSKIKYIVNPSLPIDKLFDAHSLTLQASSL